MNKIIVNADDFGLTESCSNAIVEAFKENLISSTTAIANGKYIEQAYQLARDNDFSDKIGIHINLTEGVPLTERIKKDSFFCENGMFHDRINRLQKPDKNQIENLKNEVTAQIERLLNLGFTLTHADSHHHIHTDIFFEDTIKDVLFSYGIKKIRIHRNFGKIKFYKRVGKSLYNIKLHRQGFITTEKMGSFEDLQNSPKTVSDNLCEIMVHPDFDKLGRLIDRTDYKNDMPIGQDLSDIRKYTNGINLMSYKEL